jgi:hypothetical protein
MKNKNILLSLAVSGLLIGASSLSVAKEPNPTTASFSHEMAKLVNIDADNYGLVDAAIERVLLAKQQKVEIQHARHSESVTNNLGRATFSPRSSRSNLVTNNIPLMGDIQVMVDPKNSVRNVLGKRE